MNKHAYTPAAHLRTILCNMAPQKGIAHFNNDVLDRIKEELMVVLEMFDLEINDCCVRHVVKAIERLNLTTHTIMYKHEIFYLLTGKPRPNVTKKQEAQMMAYFEVHDAEYKVSPRNYMHFEDIIMDIDEKLGFNLFTNL